MCPPVRLRACPSESSGAASPRTPARVALRLQCLCCVFSKQRPSRPLTANVHPLLGQLTCGPCEEKDRKETNKRMRECTTREEQTRRRREKFSEWHVWLSLTSRRFYPGSSPPFSSPSFYPPSSLSLTLRPPFPLPLFFSPSSIGLILWLGILLVRVFAFIKYISAPLFPPRYIPLYFYSAPQYVTFAVLCIL